MDDFEELIQGQALAGEVGRQAQITAAAQMYLEEQQKSLAETQLEVESIITKCYHLLKQDVLIPNDETGKLDWVVITDKKKLILSTEGVEKIMKLINFYINKSNLLTNFDEDEIQMLMKTFMVELNSSLFLKYETIFRQPTFEECKQIILERNEEKVKMKKFAGELLGIKIDEKAVREELLKEMEWRLEEQFKKVKKEQIKEKIKEYWTIIAELEVIVFGALNRAYMDEERGSIRRHQNVSEIIGARGNISPKQEGGIMKWLKG